MSFKEYKGKDKYHVRVHKTITHPSIITEKDEKFLYGYDTTTDETKYRKRKKSYCPLESKLSGKKGTSYLCKKRFKDKKNRFSKPYPNVHLIKKDEELIDSLENKYKKAQKKS